MTSPGTAVRSMKTGVLMMAEVVKKTARPAVSVTTASANEGKDKCSGW